MELSLYNVIVAPYVSTKAHTAYRLNKQIVLRVHPEANKPLVAQALKKLFNLDVEKVRIIVRKGKNRRVGRHMTTGSIVKKAIVTLKDGNVVDFVGWSRPPAGEASSEQQPV